MQIEDGRFYFVNDEFINKYGTKYKLMSKEELGKEEFAVDTSISGYQYMMCNSSNYYND